MFNLFELMQQQAQGQSPAEMMARQFGVSPPQAESAIDALLPAFALVLQRRLQDPSAWPKLFQIFATAQQQAMTETAMKAMGQPQPSAAAPFGGDLAGMMFGSQDIARQIASQAAMVTGLQPPVLQQMMTAMATTFAGAMGKALAEQGMGAWLKAMGAGEAKPSPEAANPFAAFNELMGSMMGKAPPPSGPDKAAMPMPSDYLDPKAMGAFINQMMGGKPSEPAPPNAEPEPEPAPAPEPAAEPQAAGLDALNRMVETGREVQEQQFKAMQAILAQMFPGGASS